MVGALTLLKSRRMKKGARVLVRIDADVTVTRGVLEPESRYRLDAALPTLKYLLRKKCVLTLMGHRGRPGGKKIAALSLAPVQKYLETRLKKELGVAGQKHLKFLPNTRFDPREEKNDLNFARELAQNQDLFVNESFATAHRAHASTVGVAKILPNCAGLRFAAEVMALTRVRDAATRPIVLILGGIKLETKLPLIKKFLSRAAKIYLLGGMANTFLGADGFDIGASVSEPEYFKKARALLRTGKIEIPVDVIREQNKIMDIGPGALTRINEMLRQLKPATIIWNGPAGVFEKSPYDLGTKQIVKMLIERGRCGALVVAGGGETVSAILSAAHRSGRGAITTARLPRGFSHVSVGGGAMLEFLSGKKLPAITVLQK